MVAPALSSSVVDTPLSCFEECGKKFTNLNLHTTLMHKKKRVPANITTVKCYLCKRTLKKENEATHMKKVHRNELSESDPFLPFKDTWRRIDQFTPVDDASHQRSVLATSFFLVQLKSPCRNVFQPAILRDQIFTTRDGGPFPKPPLSLF